ncbi:hypothetical protein AK812_SmicGene29363 [Symbiodinium microadriaticum]|uniref:Uncharacterized protein n=1 Tax=Symbiodinium microadriaticum TaxID=2951 RepID=A0A1Q9D251_SYMMI|nr:hypothetical protein AK812_SmicGene29363 [Symbiodinium microadriaticum]
MDTNRPPILEVPLTPSAASTMATPTRSMDDPVTHPNMYTHRTGKGPEGRKGLDKPTESQEMTGSDNPHWNKRASEALVGKMAQLLLRHEDFITGLSQSTFWVLFEGTAPPLSAVAAQARLGQDHIVPKVGCRIEGSFGSHHTGPGQQQALGLQAMAEPDLFPYKKWNATHRALENIPDRAPLTLKEVLTILTLLNEAIILVTQEAVLVNYHANRRLQEEMAGPTVMCDGGTLGGADGFRFVFDSAGAPTVTAVLCAQLEVTRKGVAWTGTGFVAGSADNMPAPPAAAGDLAAHLKCQQPDGEKPILIEIVDSHDEVRMETVEGHQRYFVQGALDERRAATLFADDTHFAWTINSMIVKSADPDAKAWFRAKLDALESVVVQAHAAREEMLLVMGQPLGDALAPNASGEKEKETEEDDENRRKWPKPSSKGGKGAQHGGWSSGWGGHKRQWEAHRDSSSSDQMPQLDRATQDLLRGMVRVVLRQTADNWQNQFSQGTVKSPLRLVLFMTMLQLLKTKGPNALSPAWVYHSWDPSAKKQIVSEAPPLAHAEALRQVDLLLHHAPQDGALKNFKTARRMSAKDSYAAEEPQLIKQLKESYMGTAFCDWAKSSAPWNSDA